MGKAKKRSLHLGINDTFSSLSREASIKVAIEMLKNQQKDAYSLITLFGLTAEELLEAGASYEQIIGLKGIINA